MQGQQFTLGFFAVLALALTGCGPAEPAKPPPPPLFPPPAADSSAHVPVEPPVPQPVVANTATIAPVTDPVTSDVVEPTVAETANTVQETAQADAAAVVPVAAADGPDDSEILTPLVPDPVTPPAAAPQAPDVPVAPPPNWLSMPVPVGHPFFLRRRFPCKGEITRGLLKVACDGEADIFINGKPVVHVRDGSITMEVDRFLNPGVNAIGIYARKAEAPGAVALWLNYLGPETARVLRTDTTWQGKHMPEAGWTTADLVGRGWFQPTDLGALGADARGTPKAFENLRLVRSVPRQPPRQAAPASDIFVPRDFRVEQLYAVPREQGSWITVCAEPQGGLLFTAHGGGLYRLTPRAGKPPMVELLEDQLQGAQGIVHHNGYLYMAVNDEKSCGVYRLEDSNGDGRYDKKTLLKKIDAVGEHGIHGIVPSPDGKRLFLTVGNKGKIPEGVDRLRSPGPFQNDSLIPSLRPARPGFNAPGGYICSFDLEGKDWELHSVGFRNCYDLAFNRDGELFAFDADAENDAGSPWYRPNRFLHVVSGGDYGWRPGVHKWQSFYPDTLPVLHESQRGSPGAIFSGANAAFPPKYREALFLLDWGRGTIGAARLSPKGASYTAEVDGFVLGKGFPVIDGTIAADGSMILVTGGRFLPSSVYRIRYVGPEAPGDPEPNIDPDVEIARGLRAKLETYHGVSKGEAIELALAQLGNEDRHVRHAARLALEAQPVDQWRDQALKIDAPLQVLTGALAVARQGDLGDQDALHKSLEEIVYDSLSVEERILFLRVCSLASLRFPFSEPQKQALRKRLLPHFPDANDDADYLLTSLLAHLETPELVSRILLLLGGEPASSRNDATAMIGQAISPDDAGYTLDLRQLHYVNTLRRAELPWTASQRKAYFDWLNAAYSRSHANIYGNVALAIRSDALKALGDEAAPYTLKEEKFDYAKMAPAALGPGRTWTVDEALEVIGDGPKFRHFESGKNLFTTAQCVRCHRVGTHGSTAGPDLTTLAGRFGKREILESIIHPSKVISDQYGFQQVTLKSGAVHYGRPSEQNDTVLTLHENPYDPEASTSIPVAEIAETAPAKISPMPPGLINMLSPDELTDLMAYLLSGGDFQAEYFMETIRSTGPPPPPAEMVEQSEPAEPPPPPPQD